MDLKNLQGVGLDVEADATAEQVFSKRPLHFFLYFGHLKVDATAQQAFFEGPEEYSRDRSGCRSRCNSRTGVFEKTPSFFLWILVTLKWMQQRNRGFRKDPFIFFWILITLKWMQLRNSHFPKHTLNI
jgi:hypothetical protein